MATPYFVADSASVTVLRSLASTAFGKYNLTLPDGVDLEDVYEVSAEGNELAYVASLGARRRVGGMFRRFVRADVNVTAQGEDVVPTSDVERVLDDAEKRVSGDFFLESDITRAGLGPWVPFVDFTVGDIANVEIWGRVVPLAVTRIEPKRTEHSDEDWAVHVGGQLLSDSEARLAENADIYNAVVSDRRDLAGLDGKIRAETVNRQAAVAQERTERQEEIGAERAERQEDVAQVREVLGGAQADQKVLVSQLATVQAQITGMVGDGEDPPPPGLLNSYLWMNTKLWEQQEEINRLNREFQDETRERQEKQKALDARQDELIRKVEEVRRESDRRRPRLVFATFGDYKNGYTDPEGFVKITPYESGDRGFLATCLGSWTGRLVVRATAIQAVGSNSIDSNGVVVTSTNRKFFGVPQAVHMSYSVVDMTIFPD